MLTISNASMEMFANSCSIADVDPPQVKRSTLLDTMQIVEPRVSVPVPNHILDTKLYRKVAANGSIRVDPMVVHFAGFEPGRSLSQRLDLQNMSTDIQQMHIIPPQTKYFKIKYTKNRRLVAGFVLPCLIEFFPDEWRYYYDCIRIHCKGEKNLIVPIHAYPVMNTSEFPEIIDFPAVPLGDTKTKVFPLRCHAPVDFEFRLTYLQPHPSYKVEPMTGIVPSNGEVDIFVTFSPTSFSSALMKMQLEISQFLARPLVCIVTGRCLPGMKSEILRAMDRPSEPAGALQSTLDPTAISPLDRSRSRKLKTKSPRAGTMLERETQVIERDGVRIPPDLSNPHSVGFVLNQKPGKLRVKDLHSTVFGAQSQTKALTRQMKEAMFDVAIRKDVYSERQNQLRWQVKRGEEPVTSEFCSRVLGDREEAERTYQLRRGDLDGDDECGRTVARLTWRRTTRLASTVAPPVAVFDAFVNDLWLTRHAAVDRFQQAARKVIVQRRVVPRLRALRKLLEDPEHLLNPENNTAGSASCLPRPDATDDGTVDVPQMMSITNVSSVTFPVYKTTSEQDELVANGPGSLPLKGPQEIRLKRTVPYFALKVPQLYKLLGYRSFDVQESSSSYVTESLARPLRTGAEDEVINLPPQPLIFDGLVATSASANQSEQGSEVAVLAPPKAMFQPVKYPALHIFNPVPGLMSFQSHLPYAETDPDFHLCPLPRYFSTDSSNPHMATQKQYLDREEIIKGVMSWKKFPSPSIASLSGVPSLTNVWVPRWKDPFSEDLLPFDVPLLFDSLPKDDRMGIGEQTAGGSGDLDEVQLTPEMVRAQFATVDVSCLSEEEAKEINEAPVVPAAEIGRLPATNLPFGINGPIPRDQRESELDRFLRCKQDLLGRRIQSRIRQINTITKDKSLIPR